MGFSDSAVINVQPIYQSQYAESDPDTLHCN